MQALLFAFIYLSILFIPGVALQKLFKLAAPNAVKWLLAFALSYSLFAITFTLAKYFSLPASTLTILVCGEIGLSLLFIAQRIRAASVAHYINQISLSNSVIWIVASIVAVSALYQLVFGAFTEVPADIYAHLERYQKALAYFSDNKLGYALSAKHMLLQKSGVFYYLLALATSISNISTTALIELVDFLNRTIFLLAIFSFTKLIMRRHANVNLIALIAVIFVSLQMGISVIAYIRYYTLAPTMLNMVIYLAGISLFLELIKQRFSIGVIAPYLILLLVMIAAATIHVQEALFIALVASAIVVAGLIRKPLFADTVFDDFNTRHALVALVISASVFVFLYIYSHLNIDRAANAHWRLWEFGEGYGLIPAISTLNLKNQFIQVLSLWGVLVYLLFFLNLKRYINNLFVLAAMMSPLLTILNPFFIDLFLRHNNSTTLWRFCYLIPIHLVGADLFFHYLKRARALSAALQVFAGSVALLMICLLLPISNTWNQAHFSKAPTLAQSNRALSHQGYSELIDYLTSIEEKQRILTDPMMGYMLTAMTKHTSQRQKFFRGRVFKDFTFTDYSDKPLNKYRGYLLITNTADIPLSEIGRLSNHWAPEQWRLSHYYYTDPLLENLASHPNRFNLQWANDDQSIKVYKIN